MNGLILIVKPHMPMMNKLIDVVTTFDSSSASTGPKNASMFTDEVSMSNLKDLERLLKMKIHQLSYIHQMTGLITCYLN